MYYKKVYKKQLVVKNWLRRMKIFILLSILGCQIGYAIDGYSQTTVMSINLKNKTVKEVFSEIENNSEYSFFYRDGVVDLERKVSINLKNEKIEVILDKLFANTNNTYLIIDKQITIIRKRETIPAPPPQVEVQQAPPVETQQGIRVTGAVSDDSGGSLPGVAILVVGTNVGATTDINGEFAITVPDASAVLEFRFMGFQTQEIAVGNRRILAVTMQGETAQIDELTIVAFGTQKKESVVGSVTTVNTRDLKTPSSNLTNALAGKVSGMISYQTSGEPGDDNAEFFVRGATTFGLKADPLFLIDGFESTKDDLARLSPDDIESFSIMKDASTTVMYGARSANGIISVVTKSGREGPPKVSARLDLQIATPTSIPQFLDGVEYMKLYNEATMTRNPELGPFYSEQKILATARGEHPIMYPNIDWYDALFRKSTMNRKANVNVSGGGKVATYFVAVGYENENGLLKVDKLNNFNTNIAINRVNIRTNVIFNLTSSTKLDTRISGRFQTYTGPNRSVTDLWEDIMDSNPVDFPFIYPADEAFKDADWILFGSTLTGGYMKDNAYANMVRGFENRNENNMTAMATLIQDLDFITPGLRFQLKASISNHGKFSTRRQYNPRFYGLEYYNQITGEHKLYALNPYAGYPNLGNPSLVKDADMQYYYEALLNWNNSFGQHHVGATVVAIMQENLLFPNGWTSTGFELMPERNLGISGRFTYNYDNRYFIDYSCGYNGSEKFTGEKQYGFFPAIGVGWMLSNEEFWQPLKNAVSSFKLKATWGINGNDAITKREDRFAFLSRIQQAGGGYNFGETFFTGYSGFQILRYANPDIRWEQANNYNFGTEISLFKNESLKIQADFFYADRKHVYMGRNNFPESAGFEVTTIYGNTGRIKAHGIDGSIDFEHSFSNSFWLTARGNFTWSTNRIVELDEKNYTDKYLSRRGHSWTQRWGLVGERLFVDDLEIQNSPEQVWGRYQAGDIKYKDINKDGIVNENDMVPMGYPESPEIQYGFGLSTGYKKWDFSFFLQGNAMVSFRINAGIGEAGIAPFTYQRNALKLVAEDHWSDTNPNEHAFYPRLSVNQINNNLMSSSWWLREGSFMRLKTVELGYRLPDFEKIGLKSCRVYVTVENILTVSPFKLWDPELRSKGLAYPPNKRFNMGIHLNF